MTDNKRTLYFMLSALGIAAVIALYTWLSGTDFSSTPEQTTVTAGEEVAQTIKNQIKALEVHSITPQQYNNLRTEIIGYYQQQDITEDLKDTYLNQLNDTYTELSFAKVQDLLLQDPLPEEDIQKILAHLTTLKADKNKIAEVKRKIQWYHYFTQTLPAKIDTFIEKPSSEFNTEEYDKLQEEVSELKYTEFEVSASVKQTQENNLQKLKEAYDHYRLYKERMYDIYND